MDINTSNASASLSVLARPNEQPKAVQDLLDKTIEDSDALKVDEAQQARIAAFTGKGQLINTTA